MTRKGRVDKTLLMTGADAWPSMRCQSQERILEKARGNWNYWWIFRVHHEENRDKGSSPSNPSQENDKSEIQNTHYYQRKTDGLEVSFFCISGTKKTWLRINVDKGVERMEDLYFDICKPWPFPTCTLSAPV